MNIDQISMSAMDARAAFVEYRDAVRARHSKEDETLMLGYRALAKGRQILDLVGVMRGAGVDAQFRPRLAICRADATKCVYEPGPPRFHANERAPSRNTRSYVELPRETFPRSPHGDYTLTPAGKVSWNPISAMVPLVPPRFRPVGSLANYHLLWEPIWQPEPPVDPILLRHLSGSLYAVLAQWDMTPLERAVLRGRFSTP